MSRGGKIMSVVMTLSFGERIKRARNAKKLSQKALADLMNVARSTVSMWENEANIPDAVVLSRLANVLETTTDYLTGLTDNPGSGEDLPKKCLRIRTKLGKSRAEFGELVGLSESQVEMLEEGKIDRENIVYFRTALVLGGLYERGLAKSVKEMKLVPILGRVCAGDGAPAEQEILGYVTDDSGSDFALKVSGDSMAPRINDGDLVFVRKQNIAENGQFVVAYVNGNDGVIREFNRYDNIIVLSPVNEKHNKIILNLRENPCWGIVGIIVGRKEIF
jgi:repressor LexA